MLPLLFCFLACRRHRSWSSGSAAWKYRGCCLSQHGLSTLCRLPKSALPRKPSSQLPLIYVLQLYFHLPQGEYADSLRLKARSEHGPGRADSWCLFLLPQLGHPLRGTAHVHWPAGVVSGLTKALILRCYTHTWLIPWKCLSKFLDGGGGGREGGRQAPTKKTACISVVSKLPLRQLPRRGSHLLLLCNWKGRKSTLK